VEVPVGVTVGVPVGMSVGVTVGVPVGMPVGVGCVSCTCQVTPCSPGGQVGAVVSEREENPPPDLAHP
jgi:hypothetical protein